MRWTRRVRLPRGARQSGASVEADGGREDSLAGGGVSPMVEAQGGRPGRRAWRPAVTAVLGALVGGALVYAALPGYRALAASFAQIQTVPVSAAQQASGAPAVAVYTALSPSVVLVRSESNVQSVYGTQSQVDWGSGVIFNSAGYIVTNDHVVAGSTKVTVTLKDGTSYPATVVGGDASTDLAVLKINAGKPLPAATFANSNDVTPGEVAIAIGNPLGPRFEQSVTTGVVSALRKMLYGLNSESERVTEMIQTNANINPGNSGGALANAQGEVIGITTMKVAQTGEAGVSATGLGFAIPSNTVEQVVNDIVRYGYVKRAWLGVTVGGSGSSSPTAQETLTVTSVTAGGPAVGQLQPNDVIRSWNGQPVANIYDLIADLNAATPGQTVAVGILRGGAAQTVHITLGTAPRSQTSAAATSVPTQTGTSGGFLPFPFPSTVGPARRSPGVVA